MFIISTIEYYNFCNKLLSNYFNFTWQNKIQDKNSNQWKDTVMSWQNVTLRSVITFSYDSPIISFQTALITQQYLSKVH